MKTMLVALLFLAACTASTGPREETCTDREDLLPVCQGACGESPVNCPGVASFPFFAGPATCTDPDRDGGLTGCAIVRSLPHAGLADGGAAPPTVLCCP